MSNFYHLASRWDNVSTLILIISPGFLWLPPPFNVSKWKVHSKETFLEFLPSLKYSLQAFGKFYYLSVADLFLIQPGLGIHWNPHKGPSPLSPLHFGPHPHVSALTFAWSLSTHIEWDLTESLQLWKHLHSLPLHSKPSPVLAQPPSPSLLQLGLTLWPHPPLLTTPPPQPCFLLQLHSSSFSPSMHPCTDPWEQRPVFTTVFLYSDPRTVPSDFI